MSTRDIDPGDATTIELSVDGDLAVSGWDRRLVHLVDDEDEESRTHVQIADGTLRINVAGDARVHVPRYLRLRLVNTGGDLRVQTLSGGLEIQEVGGDLHVQDVQGEVGLASAQGDLRIENITGAVTGRDVAGDLTAILVNGDLSIAAVGGDVRCESISGSVSLADPVQGDVKISRVDGVVLIGSVQGDLELSGCRQAQVGSVSGDLAARHVAEEVTVAHVGGDATFDDCRGLVSCDHVDGDFTGRDLPGGLAARHVSGRVKLSTAFAPDRAYDVTTSGAATVVLTGDPREASVRFDLRRSDGGRLDVDLPLEDVESSAGALRGRIGDGLATVRVESGGSLRLTSREGQRQSSGFMEGIFDNINEEMTRAFSAFGNFGPPPDLGERIRQTTEQATRKGNEAFRRATEREAQRARHEAQRVREEAQHLREEAQRAAERGRREAERAARHAERHAWSGVGRGQPFFGWTPPQPAAPPAPQPRPRATDEERLAILRMLSEGKISAEDAARLLEALGS